jgi:tetratricopeptide (TPR) repeat protein
VEFQAFKPGCISVSLRSWKLRSIASVIALAPILALTGETLRVATAASLGESHAITKVRWSLRLDPENPELYHRLALVSYHAALSLQSTESTRASEVIEALRKALELNPRQASYWSDLAMVCDGLNRQDCAGPAFTQALNLRPMNPHLHWLAANHCLRAGQIEAALGHFQQLLAMDPTYAQDTFHICIRALDNPLTVWERALPRDADVGLKLTYINVLAEEGHVKSAYEIWARTVNSSSRFLFASVRPFLEKLIAVGHIQEAKAVWLDLEKLGIVTVSEGEGQDNQIFNGDFERVPLDAGFDWRYVQAHYVSLDFADVSAHRGSRCLRLDFTVGRNEGYEPVYELTPVLSNQSYILTAYVRSEGITSDSGPRLRVVDPACESCLHAASEGTVGTTPWHQVKFTFSTASSTKLAKVSIWRPLGRTYPMIISGAFWLDSVSMKAVASEHLESKPGR